MRRRRLLLAVGALALLAIGCLAALDVLAPDPEPVVDKRLARANLSRIKDGMTTGQVIAVIGRPPNDRGPGFGMWRVVPPELENEPLEVLRWWDDGVEFWAYFREKGGYCAGAVMPRTERPRRRRRFIARVLEWLNPR